MSDEMALQPDSMVEAIPCSSGWCAKVVEGKGSFNADGKTKILTNVSDLIITASVSNKSMRLDQQLERVVDELMSTSNLISNVVDLTWCECDRIRRGNGADVSAAAAQGPEGALRHDPKRSSRGLHVLL